jgi:WD40 repeat protein
LNDAAISADGRWVVAGASDGRAFLWQTENSSRPPTVLEQERPLQADEPSLGAPIDLNEPSGRVRNGILSVLADPAGRWVAGGHENGDLSIWDTTTGRQLIYFAVPASRDTRLIASDDGRWIAAVGCDKVARVFELPSSPQASTPLLQKIQSFLSSAASNGLSSEEASFDQHKIQSH